MRKEVITYMLEENEIYNSILIEYQLSSSILEHMKETVEDLAKSRMEICKLFKITKFNIEGLEAYEKELIRNINIDKSNIKDCEKKQMELKDEIKVKKQEIKMIKLQINKLEDKLRKEQQESRKLGEDLRIFRSREKFKLIKILLTRRYRKVYFKYSNELNIKNKIKACNESKEKIRGEKYVCNNSINKYNRKIIVNKTALSEIRKRIITMQKRIDFFIIKLQGLMDYKEMEKKFQLEVQRHDKFTKR